MLLALMLAAGPLLVEAAPIRHLAGLIEPDLAGLESAIERCERDALLLASRGIDRIHLLAQFDGIPDAARRRALERDGVRFGGYLPRHAWVVSVPVNDIAALAARDGVRWLQPWSPSLKLHPRVASHSWSPWSVDREHPGRVVVFVQLHHDVDLAQGAVIAEAHGGKAFGPVKGLHGLSVLIDEQAIGFLATEEDVLWIEEVPPPLTHNNNGALSEARADVLGDPPYELKGFGVNLFVFDGGDVWETHETFRLSPLPDRVTCFMNPNFDCIPDFYSHATHVAGTAAGDGSGSDGLRGRGVAPFSQILSGTCLIDIEEIFWADPGNIEVAYRDARNDYQADLSNNSLGSNTASNGYDCSLEGDYGISSALIDNLARGENTDMVGPMLMVWSNGNERTGRDAPSTIRGRCGANFHTTAPPACSKNSIHVGATNSDGGSMTRFSSWGPCDDGRVKPVVIAPGCETGRKGEDGVYSSTGDDSNYSTKCGTSMAAPVVSGILTLFIEQWRDLGYGGPDDRPLPALAKAMVIHTALDRGQDGLDYIHGFGQVDATALIDLLRDDTSGLGLWGTGTAVHGACQHDDVVVSLGSSEIKATLVWDDPAAAAYVATALVNDLDLYLESPGGTIHRPWVLDPSDPMAAAGTGINTVDNQEQVVVEDPEAGIWQRWVCGTDVPEGPQTYGFVTTVRPRTYFHDSCTELIVNGSFANGTEGWTLDGAQRELCPGALPGQRRYCLAFGGSSSDVDQAWTEVTIPADAVRAELTGDWYMETSEGLNGHNYDRFHADVRTVGTIHLVRAVVDERWDGYPEQDLQSSTRLPFANIDLTRFAGSSVNLGFRSETNDVYPTTFWIDNLSIEVCFEATVFADGLESGDTGAWSTTSP